MWVPGKTAELSISPEDTKSAASHHGFSVHASEWSDHTVTINLRRDGGFPVIDPSRLNITPVGDDGQPIERVKERASHNLLESLRRQWLASGKGDKEGAEERFSAHVVSELFVEPSRSRLGSKVVELTTEEPIHQKSP